MKLLILAAFLLAAWYVIRELSDFRPRLRAFEPDEQDGGG